MSCKCCRDFNPKNSHLPASDSFPVLSRKGGTCRKLFCRSHCKNQEKVSRSSSQLPRLSFGVRFTDLKAENCKLRKKIKKGSHCAQCQLPVGKKIQGSEMRTGIRKRGRIRSGLCPLLEWRENKENVGWDVKESRKE